MLMQIAEPGESKVVKLSLSPRDLSAYDPHQHAWVPETGVYDLSIGSSSADVRLVKNIQVVADVR